jgi:hypothetical protein
MRSISKEKRGIPEYYEKEKLGGVCATILMRSKT